MTKRSRGVSNTRCNAMVSSTTPRFGPRCPPVWERTFTSSSRTSCASCGNSCSPSALISAGEPTVSSKRGGVTASEEFDFIIVVLGWLYRGAGRRRFLARLEIFHECFAGAIAGDYLNLLFRADQAFLTDLTEIHPLFVTNDQIFQRQLTRFHLLDDCLQSIHRSLEIRFSVGRFGLCGHRRIRN